MKGSERLVIEDVHKTMGAVRALMGVSFSVRQMVIGLASAMLPLAAAKLLFF